MRIVEYVRKAMHPDSLTGKMLKDLLAGLAVGVYLALILYFGGRNMLQQYFFDYYTKEAELVQDLGEYIRKNKVGGTGCKKAASVDRG